MSKILVTGGYGFIGSHFINYLLENTNHSITVIDKMTYASNIENVKSKSVRLIKKDICDVTIEDVEGFDYVVHFAAESHVDNSITNGLPFVKSNVEGTFNMVEVCRNNKSLKKFLHISTDEVYGDLNDYENKISSVETDLLNPSSYYSATKTSAEHIVTSAGRTFDFPYLITRTCNNYGENQHTEKFIPKIIDSIKNGLEVPVYGDGKQVREWIHADDNAKAIYTLLMSDEYNTVYNIGTSETYQNIDLLNMIGEIIGREVNFKFVQDRLGHDRKYSLNSEKYESKFGKIQTIKIKNWLKNNIK